MFVKLKFLLFSYGFMYSILFLTIKRASVLPNKDTSTIRSITSEIFYLNSIKYLNSFRHKNDQNRMYRAIERKPLDIYLTIEPSIFTNRIVSFHTRSYNSSFPSPTIIVAPGDIVNIYITNNLLNNSDINDSNLHIHGLHISSFGIEDSVFDKIKPGKSRKYVYNIPNDHPSGTFWYHPHQHGNINSQLSGLMAGAFIIVDMPYKTPKEILLMEDVILFIQAICIEKCHGLYDKLDDVLNNNFYNSSMNDVKINSSVQVENHVHFSSKKEFTFLINGEFIPEIQLEKEIYKRFRFINAVSNNIVEIRLEGNETNCEMYTLAKDGIYVEKTRRISIIIIPPGGRMDIAIKCTKIGTFYFMNDPESKRDKILGPSRGHRGVKQRILVLKVLEVTNEKNMAPIDFENINLPKIPKYMENSLIRLMNRTSNIIPYNYEFSSWMENNVLTFGVNRKKLDMDHVSYKMNIGSIQEWNLSSKTYGCSVFSNNKDQKSRHMGCHPMNHPFHIHLTHFQIIGSSHLDALQKNSTVVNSDTDLINENDLRDVYEVGEWRDTLPLFSETIKIRFIVHDRMLGRIFTHCHIAAHSDLGMGQIVQAIV